MRIAVAGCVAALLLGMAGVASSAPAFVGLRVGFAGRYKVGVWTPVKLTLRGGDAPQSGDVRVTVLDDEGVPSRFTAPGGPWRIEAGRDTSVWLYVRIGRPGGSLLAEFLHGDQIAGHRSYEPADHGDAAEQFLPALDTNQSLLLVIGPPSTGIAEAIAGNDCLPDGKPVVVELPFGDNLPPAWYGYEGVDMVIVATSQEPVGSNLLADAPQIEALDMWIRQGGRLLLCAGTQAGRVARPESPWSRFLPGRLKAMVELRQTGVLETYAGSSIPVPLGVAGPAELRVPHLVDVQGVVELSEANLPLVVRSARGFGQATFLATDLELPPLCSWKGRRLLIRRLLDQPAAQAEESDRSRPLMHQGFLDAAGQLRKSLNRFEGIQPTPFWLVLAMLSAYVFLIGPVDYYLVRHVARRMVLTWVTFPLMIVAVSVGVYYLTVDFKGHNVRLHQVDLVDVDAAARVIRGTSWAELFSPRADAYNVAARPVLFQAGDQSSGHPPAGSCANDPRVLLSWFGLAGSGLGGMAARSFNSPLWTEPYEFTASLDRICGLPMQSWSTRSLTIRWSGRAVSPVRAELVAEDRSLSGAVTSDLPFPLLRCRLAYGPWSHELGTLDRGTPVRLGPSTRRCELQAYPTGLRTPYDRASLDSAYILQTMSFDAAVGGADYTGFQPGHQHFVDLTSVLRAGYAVLVGFAPTDFVGPLPGLELLRDGRPLAARGDEHLRVYRFVFPVRDAENRQFAAPHPQAPIPSS
jgi:hypothetical protein